MDKDVGAVRNRAFLRTRRIPFPGWHRIHIPDGTRDTARILQVLVGNQDAHMHRGPFLVPDRIHLDQDSIPDSDHN